MRVQLSMVLARLDTAETARQTDVERQDATLSAISTRVARVEMQADGLRADIRALDGRVTRQDQALQDRLTEN